MNSGIPFYKFPSQVMALVSRLPVGAFITTCDKLYNTSQINIKYFPKPNIDISFCLCSFI